MSDKIQSLKKTITESLKTITDSQKQISELKKKENDKWEFPDYYPMVKKKGNKYQAKYDFIIRDGRFIVDRKVKIICEGTKVECINAVKKYMEKLEKKILTNIYE